MPTPQPPSAWNILEIANQILRLMTPVAVGIAVYVVSRSMHKLEARYLVNQRIVEKRLKLFEDMAPLLNDLYCYFVRVGQWKELTPEDVVKNKRTLDKLFYVNKPVFSKHFEVKYLAFVSDDCFYIFSGHAKDARLRTSPLCYHGLPGWKEEWKDYFVEERLRNLPN